MLNDGPAGRTEQKRLRARGAFGGAKCRLIDPGCAGPEKQTRNIEIREKQRPHKRSDLSDAPYVFKQ